MTKFRNFRDLLALFRRGNVDRPASRVHHALQIAIVGRHEHAPREKVARIETADRLHIDKALLCDMRDQEADFVHVAQKHDLLGIFRCLARIAPAQKRPHRVNRHVIEQRLHLGHDEIPDAVFVPRHARCFAKSAQKIDVHVSLSLDWMVWDVEEIIEPATFQ